MTDVADAELGPLHAAPARGDPGPVPGIPLAAGRGAGVLRGERGHLGAVAPRGHPGCGATPPTSPRPRAWGTRATAARASASPRSTRPSTPSCAGSPHPCSRPRRWPSTGPPRSPCSTSCSTVPSPSSEPVNFSEAVANPYLSRLVGGMMGIPEADLPLVKDGATAGSLAMAGDFSDPTHGGGRRVRRVLRRLRRRVGGGARRGQCPVGDLTNRLFEPCPSGRMLTFEERVAYEVLLATGGNETTAQLLSNLLLLLEQQPEMLERLRAEPELLPVGRGGGAALHLAGHRPVPPHHPSRRRARHRGARRGEGAAHVRLGQPRRAPLRPARRVRDRPLSRAASPTPTT